MKNTVCFVVGLLAGTSAAYVILKKRFDKIVQDEFKDTRKSYLEAFKKNCPSPVERVNTEEVEEVEAIAEEQGYIDYSGIPKAKKKEELDGDRSNIPYIVSPDEFGSLIDYDVATLTYYADGVLADDDYDIIDNVDDVVGSESLTHFGEYEGDTVYVRNDRLKCDYEILIDTGNYSDIYEVH